MKKIPSDIEILEVIYNRYFDSFRAYALEESDRITRIRVPINIREIADECGVEEDMIFGRLYYHFNKKYSYKNEEGNVVTFFTSMKNEGMSVNFPLVASVLADLQSEHKKYRVATSVAVTSLVISTAAICMSLLL